MDSVIFCSFALSCTPKQSDHFPDSRLSFPGILEMFGLHLLLSLFLKVKYEDYRNCK